MSLERIDSGEPPRFLLLLPPSPESATLDSLQAAYGDTISEVLKEVATHSSDTTKAAVLEIALACPHLVGTREKPRVSLYEQTQCITAGIYKLVVVTAAQDGINVEDTDGVDVRVLLIAWSPDGPGEPAPKLPYGPVIDIGTLARSGRRWQFAFGVESEAGEAFVKAFIAAKGSAQEVNRVEGGLATHATFTQQGTPTSTSGSTASTNPAHSQHHDVAVGGTWDHIHIGHKLLITMTLFAVDNASPDVDRSATIGITGDALLVNKKHAQLLESWADRQKAVAIFFNAITDFSTPGSPGSRQASIRDDPGPNGKSIDIKYPNGLVVKCTEIQDPFGPTITEERISALVISAETRSGGKAVNDKRKELGWKELDVFEVDVLDAKAGQGEAKEGSFESKISSTAIREKLARKTDGGKM